MDRGAWWATVLGVAKSWTPLSDWELTHRDQVKFEGEKERDLVKITTQNSEVPTTEQCQRTKLSIHANLVKLVGRVGLEVGSRWCYKQMLEFCLLLMHLSERLWLSPPIFTWGSNKRQKGSYIWISFGRPMYVFLQNTFLNKILIGSSLV